MNLVGRAYSTISLSDFAVYVGMPAADEAGVLELVRSQPGGSWLYDPASKMVTPQRRPGPEVKVAPSEEKLRQLVDFVAFMEK